MDDYSEPLAQIKLRAVKLEHLLGLGHYAEAFPLAAQQVRDAEKVYDWVARAATESKR